MKSLANKFFLFIALGLLLTPAFADAEFLEFNEVEFQKARTEGKTILLDFHANWCPVCKRQIRSLEPILQEDAFKNLVAFKVDFDNSKELQAQYSVPRQSTLILFKGPNEHSRSVGVTAEGELREFLKKVL